MWASMAIEMRSRKRRCSRVSTMPTYQVAVTEAARPLAATSTRVRSPSRTPSVSIASHSASRASGSIISNVVASDPSSSFGSAR